MGKKASQLVSSTDQSYSLPRRPTPAQAWPRLSPCQRRCARAFFAKNHCVLLQALYAILPLTRNSLSSQLPLSVDTVFTYPTAATLPDNLAHFCFAPVLKLQEPSELSFCLTDSTGAEQYGVSVQVLCPHGSSSTKHRPVALCMLSGRPIYAAMSKLLHLLLPLVRQARARPLARHVAQHPSAHPHALASLCPPRARPSCLPACLHARRPAARPPIAPPRLPRCPPAPHGEGRALLRAPCCGFALLRVVLPRARSAAGCWPMKAFSTNQITQMASCQRLTPLTNYITEADTRARDTCLGVRSSLRTHARADGF